MIDTKLYWVGFNHVKGIGAVRFQALLTAFGNAEKAWHASRQDLYQTGLSARIIDEIIEVRSRLSLEQLWERIVAQGIQVLTWQDQDYPPLLKEIEAPPPVLYLRGRLLPQDQIAVAVVGTRHPTAYGRQVAEKLGEVLAHNGVTVVSGMARGIDSAAHQAVLKANGRTLAVFGCGVDLIYPPEHRKLAEQILENGALISNYPPGTPPEATNFPPRNRIISGLARAVVIVEAGPTSGALITARFAADQGRDVYAVPGNIFSPQSKGVNRLISDGAYPLLEAASVFASLNISQAQEQLVARASLPPEASEAKILAELSHEPIHVDEIRARTQLPIDEVTATLTMMELKGMARQVGAMRYIREEIMAYH